MAITAARGWRFKPTRPQGVAVRVTGAITYNFAPESGAPASGANAGTPKEPNVAEIPQEDKKSGDEINKRMDNLVKAISIALQSLREGTYLFEDILRVGMPSTIQAISILDEKGAVFDSAMREFVGKTIPTLTQPEEAMQGRHTLKLETSEGMRWIVIVTKSQ